MLQFSPCRHVRIKPCSPLAGSEPHRLSCCTQVSVMPQYSSPGRSTLASCSPENRFSNLLQRLPMYRTTSSLRTFFKFFQENYIFPRSFRSSSSTKISAPFEKKHQRPLQDRFRPLHLVSGISCLSMFSLPRLGQFPKDRSQALFTP